MNHRERAFPALIRLDPTEVDLAPIGIEDAITLRPAVQENIDVLGAALLWSLGFAASQ